MTIVENYTLTGNDPASSGLRRFTFAVKRPDGGHYTAIIDAPTEAAALARLEGQPASRPATAPTPAGDAGQQQRRRRVPDRAYKA